MRFGYTALGLMLLSGAAAGQTQQYTISSAAGGIILPPTPGTALNTGIGSAAAVATDAAGNIYFASATFYSVFKIDLNGTLTLVAGTGRQGDSGDGGPATQAALTSPSALALDPQGNLYIADGFSGRVRKVTPDGIIHTVAGNGTGCCYNNGKGDGGPATAAQLFFPYQVAADASGNVYIGEWNTSRIRKVTADGNINTVIGTGNYGYSGDGGPANAAQIGAPWGLTFDRAGNLYFSDAIPGDDIEPVETHIRKVNPDGIISTIAGSGANGYGGDGGPAAKAQFDEPGQLAVDPAGNVYVPDGDRIRKISTDGTVATIAGGQYGYSGDGGTAAAAALSSSTYGQGLGLASDSAGNLYIADTGNHRIRKISTDGTITTVGGTGQGGCCFSGDGGPANRAQLASPVGVAVAPDGSFYIADTYNNRLRKVSAGGTISTVLGDGGASLNTPAGLALDGAGNLYMAVAGSQVVLKVAVDGKVTTVAGNSSAGFSGDGGPATSAQLNWPKDVALDNAGNLYVADTGNNRVRKIAPDGTISTVAGNGNYVLSGDGGRATDATLQEPSGVTVDGAGNLYIADSEHYLVRKVSPAGIITTVAGGTNGGPPTDGVPAASTRLTWPLGVRIDAAGNLFIADLSYVRLVTPDGILHTIAGNGSWSYAGDGGPAASASTGAWGLGLGAGGQIYVADPFNSVIRLLQPVH
jgi:sugar lactone lactonase YvrE